MFNPLPGLIFSHRLWHHGEPGYVGIPAGLGNSGRIADSERTQSGLNSGEGRIGRHEITHWDSLADAGNIRPAQGSWGNSTERAFARRQLARRSASVLMRSSDARTVASHLVATWSAHQRPSPQKSAPSSPVYSSRVAPCSGWSVNRSTT